jgi:hypothetical protein
MAQISEIFDYNIDPQILFKYNPFQNEEKI